MAKMAVLPDGAHDLSDRLVRMKYEAGQMGLWKTMHALDTATNAIGWEMAEILEGKRPDHLHDYVEEE